MARLLALVLLIVSFAPPAAGQTSLATAALPPNEPFFDDCWLKPDGQTCNDANACTTGERCHRMVCMGPVPLTLMPTLSVAARKLSTGDFDLDGNPDLVGPSRPQGGVK